MTALRIHLLGPFSVFLNENPVSDKQWRSRQVRTIFKILLTQRGRIVTSDQLIEQLWPGDDPAAARRNLHVRISQLRRVLGPDLAASVLLTVDGGYAFQETAVTWLDVEVFEQNINQARRCLEHRNLPAAIKAFSAAIDYYRGPFLVEDLYETWTFSERERLREQYLTALTEMAECYAQQGRYRRAIQVCRQVLAEDTCREAIYIRLMLYHFYAGEQSQALRTYERCQAVLQREMEVDPLPATRELYRQIQAGDLRSANPVTYPPPVYQGRLFSVPYSLGQPPLIGRDKEYAWLIDRWQNPKLHTLLITGPGGVGKSRLLQEFAGYAAQEVTVYQSRPPELGSLPYTTLLRLLPLIEDWTALEIDPPKLTALALLFPEIAGQCPDLPAPPHLPPEQAEKRLHSALLDLIRQLAPVGSVFIVDDAHDIDDASLAVLLELTGMTVVLAYRQEDGAADLPLIEKTRPLLRARQADRLVITPLTPTAVHELIDILSENDLEPVKNLLSEQTNGNPLFVIAAVQHFFETGDLYTDENGRWQMAGRPVWILPPTIRQAIETRLTSLTRPQQKVMDITAVAGGRLDFPLLAQAGGLDEEVLLDVLDSLLELGLLREPRRPGQSDLAAAHSFYTEVVYESLPDFRRRRLHRQVAESMLATEKAPESIAPTLAGHFRAAGMPEKAARWLVTAGDVALARYAHTAALDYYRQALALDIVLQAEVRDKMGAIYHHLARYEESVAAYEGATAQWRADGNGLAAMRSALAQAESLRELSRFAEAAALAELVLAETAVCQHEPALAAQAHIVLANAQRSGQLAAMQEIEAHLLTARDLAQTAQANQFIGEANFWLGVLAINRGEATVALAYDRQALAYFQQIRHPGWLAITYNNLAFHALAAGQPQEALCQAKAGLALVEKAAARTSQGWLLSTLGEIQIHLGQLEDAKATLQAGLHLVKQYGPPRLEPGFLADLAKAAMVENDWAAAHRHVTTALALAGETAPQFVPRLQLLQAQVLGGWGVWPQAEEFAGQALAAAAGKKQSQVVGIARRVLAQAAAVRGHDHEAEAHFRGSLHVLCELGDSLEMARTKAAWGRWLVENGRYQSGQNLLQEAEKTFIACDSQVDLRSFCRTSP